MATTSSKHQNLTVIKDYADSLLKYEGNNHATLDSRSIINSFSGDSDQFAQFCDAISSLETQRNSFKGLLKELQKSHAAVEQLLSQQQDCNEALDYGVSKQKALFEKCCGLKFKLTEDHAVSLEFYHLRPECSDTVCSITLDVNADGMWQVIQLSPEVPGINVLLNTLNHNKNLMEFCKHVRLKFKEHVLTLL